MANESSIYETSFVKHHWNRDFDWNKDRWNVHGDQFGYENRKCYFLVDHGESPENTNPPILWYQWTGKSLIAIRQGLPEEIQSRLEKYPFTKPPVQRSRKPTPGQPDAKTRRRTIQSKLRFDMIITDGDVEFLATHPEDATWLKDHIEAQLWSKIQSLLESRQGKGSVYADGERTLTNSSTPEP
ncbi:hypothetical protein V8C34DRAFT_300975 [Trichoderma compactum]